MVFTFMSPLVDKRHATKTAHPKIAQVHDAIAADRAKMHQEKRIMKVLLLGQSESGKSTLLKNFRSRFAHAEWTRERDGWHTVVHLNVVRSINAILRIVEAEIDNNSNEDTDSDESMKFTDRHQLLLSHLAPLSIVEANLKRKLANFLDPPPFESSLRFATPFDAPGKGPRRNESYVRSWKDFLEKEATSAADPMNSIAEYKDDMKALWNDPLVRLALKNHRLQIGDTAFFLNDLDRVADRNYTVTDDDVFRARLRTLAVQGYEVTFTLEIGPNSTWRIFDVGGCRTLRHTWLPYFENVDAIIFLSVFDERLEEDPRVNRLEDSVILWTAICSSKLLVRAHLVLLLNKCDLLDQKLKQGIKINEYIPSYGNRPNDVTSFVKYLRKKLIMKRSSSDHRMVYAWVTAPDTATDLRQHSVCTVVRHAFADAILRGHLIAAWLL